MKIPVFILLFIFTSHTFAISKQEINITANKTLERFGKEIVGGEQFLNQATAFLIFPKVLKAGFGLGAEYGEGVLRQKGKNLAYYRTAAASIGFQAGAQSKSVILVFMNQKALDEFLNKKGWKAGVDGSVALVKWGMGEDINTIDIEDPVLGFVFGNKGLMFNLTLEGSKYTRIEK